MDNLSLDTVWMLLAAMLVFWMQPGFALCEAGFTRGKNTANILMKNFVDFMFGSLLFFFLGFGFMFGSEGAGFIGMPNWGDLSFYKGDLPVEGFLIFETVFCATSATIVSGAMAERTKFSMYLVYSACISLFIYPVEGHWTWGGGWLCNDAADGFMMTTFGSVFHDFAGSAIVHSVGGVLALIGAMALGPRIGKYSSDGKSRAIPGHNLTLASLGVFILWLGWFGFNPGSQLAASGEVNRTAISHVFLTTNLAAVAGGTATMFITWMKYGKPSLSLTLNGVLAGLVGITAGCDLVSPVGAIIIGLVCGVVLVHRRPRGRFVGTRCMRHSGHAPDGSTLYLWRCLLRSRLGILRRRVLRHSLHRPLGSRLRPGAVLRHQASARPAHRQSHRRGRARHLRTW